MTSDGEKFSFVFEKAYVGTFVLAENGKPYRGIYVELKFTTESKKYDTIKIIQVVRDIVYENGMPTNIVPSDPVLKALGGFDEKKPILKGYRIDQKPSRKGVSPYYGEPNGGNHLWDRSTALLLDAPCTEVVDGKTAPGGPTLYSCAIGLKTGKAPVYLGGVQWGYLINDKDKLQRVAQKVPANAPEALGAALGRWNRYPGYTKLEKIDGVAIK